MESASALGIFVLTTIGKSIGSNCGLRATTFGSAHDVITPFITSEKVIGSKIMPSRPSKEVTMVAAFVIIGTVRYASQLVGATGDAVKNMSAGELVSDAIVAVPAAGQNSLYSKLEYSRNGVKEPGAETVTGALPQLILLSASWACNSGGVGGLQALNEITAPANNMPSAELFMFFKILIPLFSRDDIKIRK
jgi:hypothetical protein